MLVRTGDVPYLETCSFLWGVFFFRELLPLVSIAPTFVRFLSDRSQVPTEVRELLSAVEWGTSGLIYKLNHIDELIASNSRGASSVLCAECRSTGSGGCPPGELVGCMSVFHVPMVGSPTVDAYYLSFFAVKKGRTRGTGTGFSERVMAELRRRRHTTVAAEGPAIGWGIIEEGNVASLKSTRGFATIVKVLVPLATCFAMPAVNPLCTRVAGAEELAQVQSRLHAQNDPSSLDMCPPASVGSFMVLRASPGGAILAGAELSSVTEIVPMRGASWWHNVVLWVLGNTKIAALSHPLCEPGHEADFFALTAAIQAETRASLCCLMFDPADDVYSRLSRHARGVDTWSQGAWGTTVTGATPKLNLFAVPLGPQQTSEEFIARMIAKPIVVPYHSS